MTEDIPNVVAPVWIYTVIEWRENAVLHSIYPVWIASFNRQFVGLALREI
tara:strand:- start:465 stop:614 length:150 start_codon:yes stop_codon:yes gene_type:complete